MVRLKWSADLIAVGVAAGIFVVTAGWFLWAEGAVRDAREVNPATLTGEANLPPLRVPPPAEVDAGWSRLPSSADLEVWAFDVFTPPKIFFDPATGRFSVSAPAAVAQDEAPLEAPFGISLVSVLRQPFRLQLVGYAGDPGQPWGIFANEETGAGIVAQSGFRFEDLGLELWELEIKREDMIVPDSMPLREIVAVALVHDPREERSIRLTSGYPAWTERPKALITLDGTGEQREVEAGNRLELGEAVIEITGVFANPDAVTAVKLLPDGGRETVRLMPDSAPSLQFGSDTVFETP